MTHLVREHMKAYVEENSNLIQVKEQMPGMYILKYKTKVFYKDLWTPELCELRGTVVDEDFNIIQRPFTKVFNPFERFAPKIHRDDIVVAPRKVNGFMAAATWHNGGLLVSTTGSLVSDYVAMANESLYQGDIESLTSALSFYTFIFEIVDPDDPHIVPEDVGAYLLGARRKLWDTPQHGLSESGLDVLARKTRFLRPEWHRTTYGNLKTMADSATHEGYMAFVEDGREVKLKTPNYLISKLLARMKGEKLLNLLNNKVNWKKTLDEEFYPLIDFLATIAPRFVELGEHDRLTIIRNFFTGELAFV